MFPISPITRPSRFFDETIQSTGGWPNCCDIRHSSLISFDNNGVDDRNVKITMGIKLNIATYIIIPLHPIIFVLV